MPPRHSALPTVLSDEVFSQGNHEEEITRVSPELEDEFPPELKPRRRLIRRRANRIQGRSLEMLGHAVEYLVDSRMFVIEPETAKAERDAVQILMRLSRLVFLECEEVVTMWDRIATLCERSAKGQGGPATHANGVSQL